MYVYLRTKFHVSSIILTSFIHGGNFNHPPLKEPLTSPHRLGLLYFMINDYPLCNKFTLVDH